MSVLVANGDNDAFTPNQNPYQNRDTKPTQEARQEPTRSPQTDLLATAENLASPSTILPTDLALSLDIQQQTPSQQSQEEEEQQSQAQQPQEEKFSCYWDASTMGSLNAISAAAIKRLRAYKPPPFPVWDRLPVSRRAAVLILLYADRRGDLRVVITMRAASLRNFSGHAAFPGGKADSLSESPYQIARREAWEEIGLPLDDSKIPHPFRIEPLCPLPCSLAKTELVVRPCVAFLHSDSPPGAPHLTADEAMMPRLDAKEVAAVFSAPFANFLRADEDPPLAGEASLPPGHWYDGRWINWQSGEPWRVHNFHVPVHDQRVVTPKVREDGQAALGDDDIGNDDGHERADTPAQRFLVWGMTGRILVDAARIAYGRNPDFEHNAEYGDEVMIERQAEEGRLLTEKKRKEVGVDATRENVNDAKM